MVSFKKKASAQVDSSDEENQNSDSESDAGRDASSASSSSSSLSKSLTSQEILLNEPFWPNGERKLTMKEGLAVFVAAASTAFNIFGSIATFGIGGICLYASTAVGALTCPAMAYQETELTKVGAFRDAVNQIRELVNELMLENNKLKENVDAVEMEVDRLKEMEDAMRGLVGQQGKNMDHFMELLKENKQINKELNDTIKARALQNIIYLVMESDSSLDFILDDNEIDILVQRMSLIEEIDIDEKSLRKMFKKNNGSVEVIIDMVKHLILDDEELDTANESMKSSLAKGIKTTGAKEYVKRPSVKATVQPGINYEE